MCCEVALRFCALLSSVEGVKFVKRKTSSQLATEMFLREPQLWFVFRLKDMQTIKKGAEDNAHNVSQSNEELESHVTRLIEERDTLLRTGVYNSSDKIIVDLDKQIREAIAAKVS